MDPLILLVGAFIGAVILAGILLFILAAVLSNLDLPI